MRGLRSKDELAEEFWQERNDLEIERDRIERNTIQDYKRWVNDTFDVWLYDYIEDNYTDNGVDGNGMSVEDILAHGSMTKIAKYLGYY